MLVFDKGNNISNINIVYIGDNKVKKKIPQ